MKRSVFQRVLSFVLVICLVIPLLPAFEFPAFASGTEKDKPVIVIAGGDFQNTGLNHAAGAEVVQGFLTQIKKDYPTADGFLGVGDYTYNYEYADGKAGKEAFQSAISTAYPGMSTDKMIWVQGNHDPDQLVTDGVLSASGAHDAAAYGVFVINEQDYMWYNDDENRIWQTARNLDTYLDTKVNEAYSKPIFVVSHLPLHYSMRTLKGGGDGKYANYIFDVLNEAGQKGLNIIFMYGHNHSHGWDDYLGGAAVYLAKGDKINIAQGSNVNYKEETLSFTYLNPGFVAYYGDTGNGGDKALTMTAFEITGDKVVVKRYDANGIHNLKSAGVIGGEYPDDDNAFPAYAADEKVYAGAQTIKLNQLLKDTSGSGITVAANGATGVWADRFAVGSASSYDDFFSYDIHVTGHVEGDPLYINVPTNYWYDATRPVTVVDHKNGTALSVPVIDGSVVFETDHCGRYSIVQAEADVGETAWGSVEYLEHVTSLREGVPYVITSYNYGWMLTGTAQTSAAQGKGLLTAGKANVNTEHLWYIKDGNLLYRNDTSKYLLMSYGANNIGDTYLGELSYRVANNIFLNTGNANRGGTFSIQRTGNATNTSFYLNRRGGTATDVVASTWLESGNNTPDSCWYFFEKKSDEIRFHVTALNDLIYVGGGTVLMPTVLADNTPVFDYDVSWSSSDASVATVNNGYVNPLKAGTVVITVALNSVNGHKLATPISVQYTITVKSAVATASGGASVTESTDAWYKRVSYIERDTPYVITIKAGNAAYRDWVLTNQVGTNGQGQGFVIKNENILTTKHTWSYDSVNLKYGNIWGNDNFLLLSGDNSGFPPATLGTKDQRLARVYLNTKDHESFSIWNDAYGVALNRLYGGDATIVTTWVEDGNRTDDSAWYFNKVVSAWNATMSFNSYDNTLYIDDVMTFKPTVTQNGEATNRYRIIWKSSDESVATVSKGEVTPVAAGDVVIYATLVSVNEKGVEEQITVQLPLTILGMKSFDISAEQASVTQFSGNRAATGAYLTVTYTDGSTKNVPITVGMLSTADGKSIDTSVAGSYGNLVVSYCGYKAFHGFTLYVAPRVIDDYPEYPDEGAVIINKTGTGVDFQYSGIGKIELSATGIPVKKGADVIVMLDTSSSMNIGMTGSSQSRLQVLTQSLNNLLNSLQTPGEDGELLDIRIAIADFNGYFTDPNSQYYIDPDDTTDGNYIRTSVANAEVYTGSKKLDADAFVDVHDLGADPFYTAGYTGASSEKYTLKYSSGTNYDYAFDAIYQLGESVRTEERDLFVIFMSDGAPFQYNYFSSQSGLNMENELKAEYWNNWLTGNMQDSMYAPNANKNYYHSEGLHWMAEAIKGDAQTKYPVIRKNDPNANENDFTQVLGLGATMYSIGFCLEKDGEIELSTMNTVIQNIASAPEYYFRADTADELQDAFSVITGEINYAATDAYFIDVMGDDYDLQLKTDTYMMNDGSNRTLTPVIQVKAYSIYTKDDVENGLCTVEQIGRRKTDANGNYIYVLLEEVTFNAAGTEAYTNVKRSSTNILVNGIICADTFFYNTTDKTVTIDLGDGKSYNLTPETFYWKVGTISTTELVLSYYVYLSGSQEGNRAAGIYDTNESATLYYTNYRGTPAEQSVASPKFPWQQATVGYGFYIVNAFGEPIVNLTTGETGSFDRAVKVTDPTYIDFLINGAKQTVNAADKYTAADLLESGYVLFDSGAEYSVSVKDDGSGSYTVVSTDPNGKKTTYVIGVESAPVNTTGTNNTTNYVTANTVVWFAVTILIDTNPDEIVIDYGVPVDIHPLVNDEKMDTGYSYLAAIGPLRSGMPEVDYTETLASGFGNKFVGKYGVAEIIYNGMSDTSKAFIRYTLNTSNGMQMDGVETFTYAAKYTGYYGKQGYYYASITIIPAENMYYEESYLTFTDSSVEGDLGKWSTDRTSITVSCFNEYGWPEVYAYCKDDRGPAGVWPGVKMVDNDKDNVYTAIVSADQIGKTVLFNNGDQSYQTADLTIAGNGAVYNPDGTWYHYSNISGNVKKVYFANDWNWDTVHAYCWGDSGEFTAWPGNAMNFDAQKGQYFIEVPANMNKIIFNDGGSNQTGNLDLQANCVYHPDGRAIAEMKRVYFNDAWGWNEVYAYWWNTSTNNGWPGTKMTFDAENGRYYVDVPAYMTNIIFNNNNNAQTGDLAVISDVIYTPEGRFVSIHGAAAENIIYFDGNFGPWNDVYAYWWNFDINNSWPGKSMSYDATTGLYSVLVPATMQNIIFNNNRTGSGENLGEIIIEGTNMVYRRTRWEYSSDEIDVFFDNTSTKWGEVYAYYWNYGDTTLTSWPGEKMTLGNNGLYHITVPANAEYIIFSSGSSLNQTGTITIASSGATYYPDGTTANNSTDDRTYYYVGNSWSKVYAHYWGPNGGTAWPGVEMTYNSSTGMYSVDVPYDMHNIIFNNGNGAQTGDLLLPGSGSIYHGEIWTEYEGDPTVQAEDRPGSAADALKHIDADNVYGYDSAYGNTKYYSLGIAPKVTVDAITGNRNNAPKATFFFTGTGFDVVSITDNRSGVMMVEVFDESGNRVRSTIVSNYYGYTYENGQWIVKEDASDCLYQVPVVKQAGLPYGKYKVVISAIYMFNLDPQGTGTYTVWLDAIRTYNPAVNDSTANDAYVSDNEANPSILNIRDILVENQGSLGMPNGTTGVTFIDGFVVGGSSKPSFTQYANQGPNNEVYLTNGQAIAFELVTNTTVKPTAVHIGAKLATGDGVKLLVNGVELTNINTATNMFYALDLNWTKNADGTWTTGTIVLSCEAASGDVLSLTDMKVTSTNGATFVTSSEEDAASVLIAASEPMVLALTRRRTLTDVLELVGVPGCAHADADKNGRCDSCNELMQPAKLHMTSISLKGNIAINYYMLLSDEVLADENAYMQFTMADGEIVTVPVHEGIKQVRSGETYYVFSCAVDAKEMTDEVICQFVYDGGCTTEFAYSVQAYANYILNYSTNENMKALVKQMLNYGAAAQLNFGYNTDKLANAGWEAPDYSNVTINGFTVAGGQGTQNAKLYSASLILKSETTLRFFFTGKVTATYNGQELEVKERSGLYYVDVVGISAKDLDEDVTITICDGTNTAEVTYNPMAYCAAVLKDTSGAFSQEMKDLVSSLYLYNQAANTYFAKEDK